MAGNKRGPKTKAGKQQSAKNSTTHGARSEAITGPDQQAHFHKFLKELVDFYKPEGPIEQLQLERIATCKAKLKSLYELEEAKLALLIDQHESNVNLYIDEFPDLTPLVKGMLQELFFLDLLGVSNQICLPCQLTEELLAEIVSEIDAFDGLLASDDDLRKYFPRLSIYLDSVESNDDSLHVRLVGIGHQLEQIVTTGVYHQAFKLIYPEKFKDVITEPTREQIEFNREIELSQERSRKRLGLKPKVIVRGAPSEFPNQDALESAFKLFKTIYEAYLMALETAKMVRARAELHRRALSLPYTEADLLMRYQTSWERRLSTLIGEFMQLRRMRLLEGPS